MKGIYLAVIAAHQMETHFTLMVILTASYAKPVPLGMRKIITVTKCLQMYNLKDLPYGCNEEVYQNRRAKNIRSSETENFYATIITQATEYFREQK